MHIAGAVASLWSVLPTPCAGLSTWWFDLGYGDADLSQSMGDGGPVTPGSFHSEQQVPVVRLMIQTKALFIAVGWE
ncbi:hypothetical protein CQ016_10955 [Arthrobacter sp. MYb222]|nr:hypothetical protein CQ016_10955 [Arthrobacter sp. MYb222]